MMGAFQDLIRVLFGAASEGQWRIVVIFSARLDESGTDGRSPYTVVAGAVAPIEQWEEMETAWENLLRRSNIRFVHTKEFRERSGDFDGWSDF